MFVKMRITYTWTGLLERCCRLKLKDDDNEIVDLGGYVDKEMWRYIITRNLLYTQIVRLSSNLSSKRSTLIKYPTWLILAGSGIRGTRM